MLKNDFVSKFIWPWFFWRYFSLFCFYLGFLWGWEESWLVCIWWLLHVRNLTQAAYKCIVIKKVEILRSIRSIVSLSHTPMHLLWNDFKLLFFFHVSFQENQYLQFTCFFFLLFWRVQGLKYPFLVKRLACMVVCGTMSASSLNILQPTTLPSNAIPQVIDYFLLQ